MVSTCLMRSLRSQGMSRKDAIAAFSAGAAAVLGAAAVPAAVFAAEEAAAPTEAAPAVSDGPPTDWGLTKQYYPVRHKERKRGRQAHTHTHTHTAGFCVDVILPVLPEHGLGTSCIYRCSPEPSSPLWAGTLM